MKEALHKSTYSMISLYEKPEQAEVTHMETD